MIPKTIYELLPTAYLVGGTASAVAVDTSVGLICGAALVACGYYIGRARERYRVQQAATKAKGWQRSIV